jgi:RNA polymerase sigma factor (sigma-70 family)
MTRHAPDESAAQLFATFRAGYQALGQLLEQHRAYVLQIVNDEIDRRLAPRQGASDIVQNAFQNILENLQRATGGLWAVAADEDLTTWLRRVALNALYNEHRYEGQQKRDFHRDQPVSQAADAPAGDRTPSSIVSAREQHELLRQTVNDLPEADRILLRLREVHDWGYKALAELLDGQESEAGRMRVQRRLTELLLRLKETGPFKEPDR